MKSFKRFLNEDHASDQLIRDEASYLWQLIYPAIVGLRDNSGLTGKRGFDSKKTGSYRKYQDWDYHIGFSGQPMVIANIGELTELPQYARLDFAIEEGPATHQAYYDPHRKRIVIAVDDFEKLKDFDHDTWRNYFIHEFVHYTDFTRKFSDRVSRVLSSGVESAVKNKKAYFNSPIEMNAYYQDGIQKFDVELRKLKAMADLHIKHGELEKLDDMIWGDDPIIRASYKYDNFQDMMRMNFSPGFIAHIRPSNWKRVQRRMYSYWAETVKPEVQKVLDKIRSAIKGTKYDPDTWEEKSEQV